MWTRLKARLLWVQCYAFLASDIDLKMNFTFIIVRHTQKKKIFKMYDLQKK